jgi:hypothetical protein
MVGDEMTSVSVVTEIDFSDILTQINQQLVREILGETKGSEFIRDHCRDFERAFMVLAIPDSEMRIMRIANEVLQQELRDCLSSPFWSRRAEAKRCIKQHLNLVYTLWGGSR